MSKTLLYKIPFIALLFGFAVIVPFLAFAQTYPDTGSYNLPNVWNPVDLGSQLLVCTGVPATAPSGVMGPVRSVNYCKNVCDLVYQVIWIVYLAITWVIWVIAPLSFVAGGIMYMFAGASPGLESTAKSVLKGAVIGVAIVLCSFIIINTVVSFFGIAKIGGFSPGTSACSVAPNAPANGGASGS